LAADGVATLTDVDQVRVERRIAASPAALYEMVSDVTRMGSWSPETTSAHWLGAAHGPVPGARFKGANKHGWRRWRTTCTVLAAEPARHFSFDVGFGPLPVSHWSYEFVPDGDGCRVVETWTDRRPGWMIRTSPVMMGVSDRRGHNRGGMEATLAQLQKAAESPA
jgi:uncharacterized protein YndB with AHSA1/START domain